MDLTPIISAVVDHALASGLFEQVNGHEPANAPTSGLTAGVWVDSITPVQSSGLASGSGRLALQVRLYTNVAPERLDAIDPEMLGAVDTLMTAYSGDFQLGLPGGVRCVDLLGQAGEPLSAKAGYLEQDGTVYRVMTITMPIILNDLWAQEA